MRWQDRTTGSMNMNGWRKTRKKKLEIKQKFFPSLILSYADPSPSLCECLENLSDNEMKELVMLVVSYWVDPYDMKQWAKDLKNWYWENL